MKSESENIIRLLFSGDRDNRKLGLLLYKSTNIKGVQKEVNQYVGEIQKHYDMILLQVYPDFKKFNRVSIEYIINNSQYYLDDYNLYKKRGEHKTVVFESGDIPRLYSF